MSFRSGSRCEISSSIEACVDLDIAPLHDDMDVNNPRSFSTGGVLACGIPTGRSRLAVKLPKKALAALPKTSLCQNSSS